MARRCEGWTRRGGAFSFGPATWRQCENEGTVMLTCLNDGAKKPVTLPACMECWQRAIDNKGTTVVSAEPIGPTQTTEGE